MYVEEVVGEAGGPGFGRLGWLVFRGWWSGSWRLLSVLEAADEGRGAADNK